MSQVNDKDQNSQQWETDTSIHRAFAGGAREVQRICIAGQSGGQVLLPPTPLEMRTDDNGVLLSDAAALYRKRAQLTILVNFYKRTAVYLTGMAFQGGKVTWNLPEELKYLEINADGLGNGLTAFFAWQFLHGLMEGTRGCYIFSDVPEGVSGLTKEQADKEGYNVYLQDVPGGNILGERNGQIRISCEKQVDDGEFGWKLEEVVYVLDPEKIVKFEKNDTAGFSPADPIKHNIGKAPIEFFIPGQMVGRTFGIPVLDDLAYIQLDHLRVTSWAAQYREASNWLWIHSHGYDLTNGLVTPLTVWSTPDTESSSDESSHAPFIKIAEPSGKVSEYNLNELERLEKKGALWGLLQLSPKTVPTTAKENQLTQMATNSSLSMWAGEFELFAQRCIEMVAKMKGVDLTEEIEEEIEGRKITVRQTRKVCTLEKDYSTVDPEFFKVLIEMVKEGGLSKKTLFDSVKISGSVRTENDWPEEAKQIEEEGIRGDQVITETGTADLLLGGGL